MAQVVQQNFNVYPARGFPGMLAQPAAMCVTDSGQLHVPTPGTSRNPRPGDALYYDRTENQFAIPTTAAQSLQVCGILGYRQDHVASTTHVVEYEDNDAIQVIRVGAVWVTAGSAVEYDDLVAWDRTDYKWDVLTKPTAVNEMPEHPIYSADFETIADTNVFIARIGFGRVL